MKINKEITKYLNSLDGELSSSDLEIVKEAFLNVKSKFSGSQYMDIIQLALECVIYNKRVYGCVFYHQVVDYIFKNLEVRDKDLIIFSNIEEDDEIVDEREEVVSYSR